MQALIFAFAIKIKIFFFIVYYFFNLIVQEFNYKIKKSIFYFHFNSFFFQNMYLKYLTEYLIKHEFNIILSKEIFKKKKKKKF